VIESPAHATMIGVGVGPRVGCKVTVGARVYDGASDGSGVVGLGVVGRGDGAGDGRGVGS